MEAIARVVSYNQHGEKPVSRFQKLTYSGHVMIFLCWMIGVIVETDPKKHLRGLGVSEPGDAGSAVHSLHVRPGMRF